MNKKKRKIKHKDICIYGFGIQGKAQAMNLRDSGHDVIIANKNDKYRKEAIKLGFDVYSFKKAAEISKIIFLLIPDAEHDYFLNKIIFPYCKEGTTIVFAHGYWLRFESSSLPKKLNFLMIAPRFPGKQIRDQYLKGHGVPAFVDKVQDFTGELNGICKVLIESLGFKKGGILNVKYTQEAELDLFIEQFMAPLFFASVEESFDFLVKSGYPPEAVCMELYFSGELGAVRSMMGKYGLYKTMLANASPTARFGITSSRDIVWNKLLKKTISDQLKRIKTGKFSRQLSNEKVYAKTIHNFFKKNITQDIMSTEKKVRRKIKGIEN